MSWMAIAQNLEKEIRTLPIQDISYGILEESSKRENRIHKLITSSTDALPSAERLRIQEEFLGAGPLASLIIDEEVTEILVLSKSEIWFEKHGQLSKAPDTFLSDLTYQSFIERLCQESKTHFNLERPATNGKFRDFRLHLISSEITQGSHNVSLRRHPKSPWTLERLRCNKWCEESHLRTIREILNNKENFMVVGTTGCGKTSFLNACLQALPSNERVIVIEDTSELSIPNSVSTKLVSRQDANGILPTIDQSELVRQSLRMRPDRLVVGEVRGPEAKDLLMALSTGHEGSFGSLHASSAAQALLRLEMLVQLGAPQWDLRAIRNLIFLSLKYIFVVEKNPEVGRRLQGLYRISSIEETGILLERLF